MILIGYFDGLRTMSLQNLQTQRISNIRICENVFCVEFVIFVHFSRVAPAYPHLKLYYQQIQLEQNWAVFSWTFVLESRGL